MRSSPATGIFVDTTDQQTESRTARPPARSGVLRKPSCGECAELPAALTVGTPQAERFVTTCPKTCYLTKAKSRYGIASRGRFVEITAEGWLNLTVTDD